MDGLFDVTTWAKRLNDLVDEIVAIGDPEIAISCIRHYDNARKKIDRIQAFPHYGARSQIIDWKQLDGPHVRITVLKDFTCYLAVHPDDYRLILETCVRSDLKGLKASVRAETYTNGVVTTLRFINGENAVLGSVHIYNGGD